MGILTAACSSTPANFAGSYAVTAVSGANDCGFAGWTEGGSTQVTATITQDGSDAQFTVPPSTGVGFVLVAFLGTSTFAGKVVGDEFTATYLGTKQAQQGSCMYTVNTKLDITIDDKGTINGTLAFTPATNADPSCGALNQCTNTDTVVGARTGP